MVMYKTVQTMGKRMAGGVKAGLLSSWKVRMPLRDRKAARAPSRRGNKIHFIDFFTFRFMMLPHDNFLYFMFGDKRHMTEVVEMEVKSTDMGKEQEEELCKRIAQMEEGDSGIKPMTRRDYMVAGMITLFCLCAVILGAWL